MYHPCVKYRVETCVIALPRHRAVPLHVKGGIMKPAAPFWEKKSLQDMTQAEWEALCDGCGRCCLIKLEDEETRTIMMTCVACRYLDSDTCRCRYYEKRREYAPQCLLLTPDTVDNYSWLPETCAYRLISEGKSLPWWHHLVSGDPQSVHDAGISVRHKIISERYVHPSDFDAYITDVFGVPSHTP